MPKMPGPPPKPTHLRVVEGDRSRRPGNDGEPRMVAAEPAFPYLLAELDEERIARSLERLTVEQLRQQAKAIGVPRYSRMRREKLVAALLDVVPGPRKRAWAYLLETLDPMRVVTPADGAALALGVEALVEYIDVARRIERDGRFWETTGRYGKQIKRHPGIDAQNKAWNRVLAVLDRFGANPAYRAKVQVPPHDAGAASPWDALEDGA